MHENGSRFDTTTRRLDDDASDAPEACGAGDVGVTTPFCGRSDAIADSVCCSLFLASSVSGAMSAARGAWQTGFAARPPTCGLGGAPGSSE